MSVAQVISDFTVQMETGKPSYERAYQMLLLSLLEIRRLEQQNKILLENKNVQS